MLYSFVCHAIIVQEECLFLIPDLSELMLQRKTHKKRKESN